MLGAIYVGLSGMNAYSKGLQTISNNVANMNTAGFKATSVSFTDMFSYGGGGLTFTGGTRQIGTGVRMGQPAIDFSQGDLRQSQGDLDLAIQGSGFLVLKDGDRTLYSRTGQFVVDEEGYISQQGTGYRLAVLDSAGRAVELNLDDKRTSAPAATTTVKFADNLSSTGTEATVSNIAVYDSAGGKQVWQVKFAPISGEAGGWNVTVTDQTGDIVGTSSLKFIGNIIDQSTAKITITDTPANADPLTVVLDFSKGVTSYSNGTLSTIRTSNVDGNAVGALTTVSVDEEGKIKLTYSNTETETLGAVAIADFRDPQALKRVGEGLFESDGDGQFRMLPSATNGIGKLVPKYLEASNVDLSEQFGDLILIQRGFQASSQVVSVSNEMIQQLFGIRGQG